MLSRLILAFAAAAGRVRRNPWVFFMVGSWLLVAVPLLWLRSSDGPLDALVDMGLFGLIALLGTWGYRREIKRQEAEIDRLTSADVGGETLSTDQVASLLYGGKRKAALREVRRSLSASPNDASLWCLWARAMVAKDKPHMAALGIEQAVKANPDHVEALYLSAWSKRFYWDFRAAHAAAQRGLRIDPTHQGLNFEQRESTRAAHQWTRARALPKHEPMPLPQPKQRVDALAVANGLNPTPSLEASRPKALPTGQETALIDEVLLVHDDPVEEVHTNRQREEAPLPGNDDFAHKPKPFPLFDQLDDDGHEPEPAPQLDQPDEDTPEPETLPLFDHVEATTDQTTTAVASVDDDGNEVEKQKGLAEIAQALDQLTERGRALNLAEPDHASPLSNVTDEESAAPLNGLRAVASQAAAALERVDAERVDEEQALAAIASVSGPSPH